VGSLRRLHPLGCVSCNGVFVEREDAQLWASDGGLEQRPRNLSSQSSTTVTGAPTPQYYRSGAPLGEPRKNSLMLSQNRRILSL
jgi:hypothetical protein